MTYIVQLIIMLNINDSRFLKSPPEKEEVEKRKLIKPVIRSMDMPDVKPMDIYEKIQKSPGFLLESRKGEEKLARFSFIGLNPILKIKIKNNFTEISGNQRYIDVLKSYTYDYNHNFDECKKIVDKIKSIVDIFSFKDPRFPRFNGGAVGYFAYDAVKEMHSSLDLDSDLDLDNDSNLNLKSSYNSDFNKDSEIEAKLENSGKNTLGEFMICKQYMVFDHVDEDLNLMELILNKDEITGSEKDINDEISKKEERYKEAEKRLEELEKEVSNINPVNRKLDRNMDINYSSNFTKKEYMDAVKKVKNYIKDGEIFQAVLSRRLDVEYHKDPFRIYVALENINPSPYMYYLDFGDGEKKIVGSSPEMLLRIQGENVMTVPIAGTRKRGNTKKEDLQLEKDLLTDEKEMAEHIMLVDLARNDIGRVSKFGTVDVKNFAEVKRFSHVQHIISRVEGKLKDDVDASDVLKSCFPAGTVSGAPKLRAIEIIEELEPDNRGVYAGSVGYIGFNGNMDFAISIRTVVAEERIAKLQLGAGIVYDSVPKREWEETNEKGEAGLEAIKLAGGSGK